LRQQRTTNSIQPEHVQERQATPQQQHAPRNDLNKNQAQIHVAGSEQVAENMETLKKFCFGGTVGASLGTTGPDISSFV